MALRRASASALCAALSVAVLGWAARAAYIPSIAGPFRIVLDHVEKCPPEMLPKREFFQHNLTIVRDRKQPDIHYVTAFVNTFITLNDNLTGHLNVASWSSRGGWKDNAYKFDYERPCTRMRIHFPVYWRMVMGWAFNDTERRCPFPPDLYSISNVSTNWDLKVPPAFFYGKYRATGSVTNPVTHELMACMRSYVTIAPKVQKQKTNSRR